jgi:arabinofuranosyltransferase
MSGPGSDAPAASSRQKIAWAWLGACACAYALVALQTAWVSDDAFISLRTASNWLAGHGLRWNADERVQTFTHPLWLLALSAAHGLTGEPFYSTLYLSWLVSTAAVAGLLFLVPGKLVEKTIGAFLLIFSQAFVDFSSSGLENPLTHLLLVAFVAVFLRCEPPRTRAIALSCIAGLGALNRLDTALLFAPALLHDAVRTRGRVAFRWYLLGALPLALWELFSLVYYGFPFPNTAYAKLGQNQGLPAVLGEGLFYLVSSLDGDAITLCTIAFCFGLACYRRDAQRLWLLLGALAYVAYVVWIGGDFMNGRFLSAPFVLAVACFASSDWLRAREAHAAAALLAVALAYAGRAPPPFTGANYGFRPGESEVNRYGLHDERRMFFRVSSLRNAARMNPARPDHPWSRHGHQMRARAALDRSARVQFVSAIGYAGYYAGPGVHIVDDWALGDALIARLPAVHGRYGHYPRIIPAGYAESLRDRKFLIVDPNLAAYYRQLALVLRAPLLSPERLRAIWRLNTGSLKDELDRYAYVRGRTITVRARARNPTSYPFVMTYVWNDFRFSTYALDDASIPGRAYELVWEITPAGARLRAPHGAVRKAELTDLRDRGYFTISLAVADRGPGEIRDLYEYRFTYRLDANGLSVQRQPSAQWIRDFPTGTWHDQAAPDVLHIESIE